MDLMVDPTTQKLVGAHGDEPQFLALSSFGEGPSEDCLQFPFAPL